MVLRMIKNNKCIYRIYIPYAPHPEILKMTKFFLSMINLISKYDFVIISKQ